MRRPVITYEPRIPTWAKYITFLAFGISLVFAGFVLGVAASMYEPDLGPPIQTSIILPEQSSEYVEFVASEMTEEESRWEFASLDEEVKCLADNMYFEGRNQSLHGKIGIGLVTLNRVEHKQYKDNICDVVWFRAKDSRSGRMTAHFSWTLDGKSDKIANKEAYASIYHLAEAMLAEGTLDNFYDFTEGATHYHADYVKPYWADDLNMVARIDEHIFYK